MPNVTLWCPPALGQQMVQVGVGAPVALATDNTVVVDSGQMAPLINAGFKLVPNKYATAPSPGTAGVEYFDTELNRLMRHNGLVWQATRTDGDMVWEDFISTLAVWPVTGTGDLDLISKITKTSGTVLGNIQTAKPVGEIQLSLDSTSEAQESVLYMHDFLNHQTGVTGAGYSFQARAYLPVLPTSTVVAALGMGSANAAGPLGLSFYMFFTMTGSGVVQIKTLDDNGAVVTTINTPLTLLTTDYHDFRIDTHGITNATTGAVTVLFYIDGVLQATVPMVLSSTHGNMQPYATVYKASGVGVGTLGIDFIRTWR